MYTEKLFKVYDNTFKIKILAKAKIKNVFEFERIISTDVLVEGKTIEENEPFEYATRLEYHYEYDLTEAKPAKNDDFYIIRVDGEKDYNTKGEIINILEVFDEEVIEIDGRII